MSNWAVIDLVLAAVLIREIFVIRAILRAKSFLFSDGEGVQKAAYSVVSPHLFFVVIPVLRESIELNGAVLYFNKVLSGHADSKLIIVTTERERAERYLYPESPDTYEIAERLAEKGLCDHIHFPDPLGRKADQLNYAAEYCREDLLLVGRSLDEASMVIYDIDSRPPLDSIDLFESAIRENRQVRVFHQSSYFELRKEASQNASLMSRLQRSVAEGGALRANRFVLAYEIPRLLSSLSRYSAQNISSCIFTHITGHGLCLRLSLLKELPFPSRSQLEDMHYSFLLGSRKEPMVPIGSLDRAEVPDSIKVQFGQMTRWFMGPGRFLMYLSDPATKPGPQAIGTAISAGFISLQWLSCAALPIFLPLIIVFGGGATYLILAVLLGAYIIGLHISEQTMKCIYGAKSGGLARFLAYPVTFLLFGVAGVVGAFKLAMKETIEGKTERD